MKSYPAWLRLLEKKIPIGLANGLMALFSFLLFGYLFLFAKVLHPDLYDHLKIAKRLVSGEQFIGHPSFFLLIQLFSGFSNHRTAELFSIWLIFSTCHFFKMKLTASFLLEFFRVPGNALILILVLAIQLAIPNPLFTEFYIKGGISPNYFHNGTLMLSWPFAFLFFRESLRFLEDEERIRIFRMVLIGFVMITIKPSFLFLWIPVMPFYALYRYGLNRKLLGILQVAVSLVVLILLQSQLLRNSSLQFKIVFNPFYYFGSFQNHLFLLLAALSFPLAILLIGFKEMAKEKLNLLFFLFSIQGLLLSFLFYDQIRGLISPNMTWQSSMVHYFWLMIGVAMVHRLLLSGRVLWLIFPLVMLGLQVYAGLCYLFEAWVYHTLFL